MRNAQVKWHVADGLKEFHLFAGIGGGIWAGKLLGNTCVGACEIDPYAQAVLKARQEDGNFPRFRIYDDITKLDGRMFLNSFDVLCGGFPCQAFSHAARGLNKAEKNLWPEMFRFVSESNAPVVFGENVQLVALESARADLESIGYTTSIIRLSNADLGCNHRRNRYWIMAKRDGVDMSMYRRDRRVYGTVWENSTKYDLPNEELHKTDRLRCVGNAQSPQVAAVAFNILAGRLYNEEAGKDIDVDTDELEDFYTPPHQTSIDLRFGNHPMVHTPTVKANFCAESMNKWPSCRRYRDVFKTVKPSDFEYLMGLPPGASGLEPIKDFT